MSERANLQKTSLNVLVNQILQNYVEWDADSIKAGWIPVQRTSLMKLVESIDKKNVSNIARESAKLCGKNSILYMYGKYDLEHVLKNIRSKAQRSGHNIKEYDESNSKGLVYDGSAKKLSYYYSGTDHYNTTAFGWIFNLLALRKILQILILHLMDILTKE